MWMDRVVGKKPLAVLLAVMLIVSLTGCQGSGGEEKKNTGTEQAKGRYVERAVPLDHGWVLALRELEDKRLLAVTESGVYESSDQGENWSPWKSMPEEMRADLAGESSLSGADISKEGSIFYQLGGAVDKLVSADGTVRQLDLELPEYGEGYRENRVVMAYFADSGDLLCMDWQRIYQIDTQSLAVKHVYDEEFSSELSDRAFCTLGDTLYFLDNQMEMKDDGTLKRREVRAETYSLTDYEPQGRQKVLEDFLVEEAGDWDTYLLMPGPEGKALYLAGEGGIYRWQTEGTAVEKIFSGSQGQMLSAYMLGGTVFSEDALLIYYEGNGLYRYSYDPEAPVQPEESLAVYSLYESPSMRQAITAFQATRADLQVSYEVGVTGEDGVTATDALKTLNTNIMAGEGPDVLMLDGMPVKSYAEKGLLMDLDSLVSEISSADGIFENVIEAYQIGDTLQAVPTHFTVPVVLGKSDLLSQAADLEGLASVAEAQREKNPEAKDILGDINPDMLLQCLLPVSSPGWMTKDGTLDPELLVEFMDRVNRIVTAQGNRGSRLTGQISAENEAFDQNPFMASVEWTAPSMGYSDAQISVGNLGNSRGLCDMLSMIKKLGDSGYQPANVYIPLNPVGISARSSQAETAGEFLEYLLKEGQLLPGTNAWPVNKTAFDQTLSQSGSVNLGLIKPESDVDGSSYEIELVWPTQEEFQELKGLIEKLDTPAVTDERILRAVVAEGSKFLHGEISVTDAADAVVDKINLYLAE